MNYLTKVCLDSRLRRSYTIKIAIVGTICLLGVILGIYSIISAKYLFALWYLIAFILGLVYVAIRINTAFPTYVATDGEKLFLSIWKNGIVPYTLPEKPSFISDFTPEKVGQYEVMIDDIDSIYIGSKKFLKRTLSEDSYPYELSRLDGDKHFDSMTKRMDFLLVQLKDGEYRFMSVTGFEIEGLCELIDVIEKNCAGVHVHTNIPKLVKMRNKIEKNYPSV